MIKLKSLREKRRERDCKFKLLLIIYFFQNLQINIDKKIWLIHVTKSNGAYIYLKKCARFRDTKGRFTRNHE